MKAAGVAYTYYHLLMLFAHERQEGPLDRIAFVTDVDAPRRVVERLRQDAPNLVHVPGRWALGAVPRRLRTRAIMARLSSLGVAQAGRLLLGSDIPPEAHLLIARARRAGRSAGLVEDGIGVYLGGPERALRRSPLRRLSGRLAYGPSYRGRNQVGENPGLDVLLLNRPDLVTWAPTAPLRLQQEDGERLAKAFAGEFDPDALKGGTLVLGPNPDNPRHGELMERMAAVARAGPGPAFFKKHPRDPSSIRTGFTALPAFLPAEACAMAGMTLVSTPSTPVYSARLLNPGRTAVDVVGAGPQERQAIAALNPEARFHG